MTEDDAVEIVLRSIGPSPPSTIRIPSPTKVSDLRSTVSLDLNLPINRLMLILKGRTMKDRNDDDDELSVRLQNGDSILVAVMPKRPAKHLQDDDEEEDDLRFQIPQSSSRWKRRLVSFLREKVRVPDIMLIAIFAVSIKTWACIILWFLLAPVAHSWNLGPLYIIGTGFLIILVNLGKRQHGDVSAYSIFNEDFRELPGTLNADRLDRDIRAGQF